MVQKILFVQVADPAAYPPLINAAWLFSEAGWHTTFVAFPRKSNSLKMPAIPNMTVVSMPARKSSRISKSELLKYCWKVLKQAIKQKPNVIYASDILSVIPSWLAAKVCGAKIIYHEHDSSTSTVHKNRIIARARDSVLHGSLRIIFPNEARARLVLEQAKIGRERLQIVWNLPRRSEVPKPRTTEAEPLIIYYHGSISRERLPETVVAAIDNFRGRVILRIVGYETISGEGYLDYLFSKYGKVTKGGIIEFLGEISRAELLETAAQADVGLAFMPLETNSLDMKHMVGASNKAFDYMAAGVPLVVSKLPDWENTFVNERFGFAVDPGSKVELETLITSLLSSRLQLNEMGERCQKQIVSEWNYDIAFAPILSAVRSVT